MPTEQKRKRRSYWVRQELILEDVRRQIVKGYYPPGERVPTRDDLERRFQASRVTIQRAFDALIREGFVEPRGRLGTFVSETPPHLYRSMLVFPMQGLPAKERPSFHQALIRASQAITTEGPQQVAIFHGVQSPDDLARFQTADEDVKYFRVGGLIFVGEPDQYEGSRLISTRQFPRVSLSRTGTPNFMPRVALNRGMYYAKALAQCEKLGRRRVALLASREDWEAELAVFRTQLGKSQLQTEEHWQHRVGAMEGRWCRQVVRLLFQGPKTQRPDALILNEEVLYQDVVDGLKAAGVDPEKDLTIIVQGFQSSKKASIASAYALRYDVDELLQEAFALIAAQRKKRAVIPQLTVLEPQWPWEIEAEPKRKRVGAARKKAKKKTKKTTRKKSAKKKAH